MNVLTIIGHCCCTFAFFGYTMLHHWQCNNITSEFFAKREVLAVQKSWRLWTLLSPYDDVQKSAIPILTSCWDIKRADILMVEIIPGLMVYQRPCMMREIEMWIVGSVTIVWTCSKQPWLVDCHIGVVNRLDCQRRRRQPLTVCIASVLGVIRFVNTRMSEPVFCGL